MLATACVASRMLRSGPCRSALRLARSVTVPLGEDDARAPTAARRPRRVVDVPAAVARRARASRCAGRARCAQLARPRPRASTIVVEPPALPVPGAQIDPRPAALATMLDELDRTRRPGRATSRSSSQAGSRVASGRRELERLLPPPQARAFRGARRRPRRGARGPRRHLGDDGPHQPGVVETDLVVVVSSAETVVHGGPGALLAACDAATIRRAAAARSLVQASGEPAWRLALAVETAVATRVALIGVSLVLDHPRLAGRSAATRTSRVALEHVASSPFRRLYSLLPGAVRRGHPRDQGRSLAVTAVFAGTPSVAHAEALVRTIELRGVRLDEPLDAIVVGVPVGRSARSAGAAQPDHVRGDGARPRASPVARRLPGPRGRDARSRALADPVVRARIAGPVPRALRRAARGDDERSPPPRRSRRRPTSALAAYRAGPRVPPAPPVRRLGRLPAGALAPRPRDRRREPRRSRRASARLRPEPLDRERARHGAWRRRRARTCRRAAGPAVSTASSRLTKPHALRPRSGRLQGSRKTGICASRFRSCAVSPRRGTSCGPARSS